MSDFNPKIYKNVYFSISLDEETVRIIDKLAHEQDASRNKIIQKCVDYALSHIAAEYDDKKQ